MTKRSIIAGTGIIAVAVVAWLLVGRARDGDTVEILGDSITVVSADELRAELSDYTLTIQAIGGLRTDQLLAAAKKAATSRPKQVVINLGTNDVLQGKGLAQVKANLETLVGTFADADCIHVVTLNTHMVVSTGPKEPELVAANAAIAQIADDHRNVDTIDWNKIVEDSMDTSGHDTITDDSIHPNAKGKLLLTKAYADALKNCGKPVKVSL